MKIKFSVYLIILLTFFLITLNTIAQQSNSSPSGKELFVRKCSKCHGQDGTKGFFGAKNLRTSKMTESELIAIISTGKKVMPSWKNRLTDGQIKLVAEYIQTLRN
jgi:cytochrome c6